MIDVILPCPFCGSSASVKECDRHVISDNLLFSVGCDSYSEAECPVYLSVTYFGTRGQAIKAWNRRKESERVGELESDLKEFRDDQDYIQGLRQENARLRKDLGISLNEYVCFLQTMTAINEHGGYQFTQPLMNARDCLNRMREKFEQTRKDSSTNEVLPDTKISSSTTNSTHTNDTSESVSTKVATSPKKGKEK